MAGKDEILQGMLGDVSDEHDKRVGSFIYDALAPAAGQFAKTDEAIQGVKDKLIIENLAGDELAQRIRERTGIIRKEATQATGQVSLTGTGTIQTGDLFETPGGIQFKAIETKQIAANGAVTIKAVVAGASGIVAALTITLFPVTLAGFTAVTNTDTTIDGFEAESDTDLLLRYYERIRTPATSGNKSQYKNWAKEVAGVGDARIIPLWNGNNTTKVVIIDADRRPASPQLVQDVQDYIDPGVTGLGDGVAPIGAFATVISAAGLTIYVDVTIVLSAGFTKEQADTNITASLTAYLKEIAFIENIVSFAKVGAAVLDSVGVEDYSGLTINGGTTNVAIGTEQVAVLGDVTVT